MQAFHPNRSLRVLATLVSFAYRGLWAAGVVVLIAAPLLKLFAGDDPDWTWGLQVPATVPDSEATVLTRWGTARLEVEDVRAHLRLPIAMLPWWLFGVLWTHAAVAFALVLLSLHQLRRIFQRARAGAPFDARNALRLRWLGLLLLSLGLWNGVAGLVTSLAVRKGLVSGGSIAVPAGLHIDVPFLLVALVLMALAEIFRRGAELEDEQALVV